jgi:putative redox protein
MATTAKVICNGDLRTTCTHLQSGTQLHTDAPVDNKGKGEAFSPTDLLATSLVACMQTIVGIYCEEHQIPFKSCVGEVEKIMYSSPRRIGELRVRLDFSLNNWKEAIQKRIRNAADTCPVAKSIHPEIKLTVDYLF